MTIDITVQERTLDEHKKLVDKIMKRDKKRQKMIDAAGLDYECPDIVSSLSYILLAILAFMSQVKIKLRIHSSYMLDWLCR